MSGDLIPALPDDLPTLAARINEEHAACVRAARATLTHALEAGQALIKAKSLVRPGEWDGWLEANVPSIKPSTERLYRYLAENLPRMLEEDGQSDKLAELSIRAARAYITVRRRPQLPAPPIPQDHSYTLPGANVSSAPIEGEFTTQPEPVTPEPAPSGRGRAARPRRPQRVPEPAEEEEEEPEEEEQDAPEPEPAPAPPQEVQAETAAELEPVRYYRTTVQGLRDIVGGNIVLCHRCGREFSLEGWADDQELSWPFLCDDCPIVALPPQPAVPFLEPPPAPSVAPPRKVTGPLAARGHGIYTFHPYWADLQGTGLAPYYYDAFGEPVEVEAKTAESAAKAFVRTRVFYEDADKEEHPWRGPIRVVSCTSELDTEPVYQGYRGYDPRVPDPLEVHALDWEWPSYRSRPEVYEQKIEKHHHERAAWEERERARREEELQDQIRRARKPERKAELEAQLAEVPAQVEQEWQRSLSVMTWHLRDAREAQERLDRAKQKFMASVWQGGEWEPVGPRFHIRGPIPLDEAGPAKEERRISVLKPKKEGA